MPRYYYNSTGRFRGVSYNEKDRKNEATGFLVYIAICAILAPFYPLYFVASHVYEFLTISLKWHALFAGATAALIIAAGLYGLWKSVIFRFVYFGSLTFAITFFVFQSTLKSHDFVWAIFFSSLVMIVGSGLIYFGSLIIRNYFSATDTTAANETASTYEVESDSAEQNLSVQPSDVSFPISNEQAETLLSKINDKTFMLLRAIVEKPHENQFASMTWIEIQKITGSRDWSHFSRGILAKLHRDLRQLTGDPHAVLLIDTDKYNRANGQGSDMRRVAIYGSAVEVLRRQFEITYGR